MAFSQIMNSGVDAKTLSVSRRLLKKGLFSLLIGLVVLFAFVWSRIRVIQLGYEVTRLNAEVGDLAKEVGEMRLETSRKKSLKRLTRIANQKNLESPKSDQVIFIEAKK